MGKAKATSDVSSKGLVDFWYANELANITERFSHTKSSELLPSPLRALRAASMLWKGVAYKFISPNWYDWGRLIIILNSLLLRPRPIVLFEVIDYGVVANDGIRGKLYRTFIRILLAPAMRRSVRLLHVMTSAERDRFMALYKLPGSVVKLIEWPLLGWIKHQDFDAKTISIDGDYVFSSGRAACDWTTLLLAAQGQPWKLVIVCSKQDLQRVNDLNRTVGAIVFSEVSKSEHDNLLAGAKICVICLREERKSSGQVRLGAAIELGVPTIASDVDGLRGYLSPNVNALAFPPMDSKELRAKIEQLLQDNQLRKSLVASAKAFCSGYSKPDYFSRLEAAVLGMDEIDQYTSR